MFRSEDAPLVATNLCVTDRAAGVTTSLCIDSTVDHVPGSLCSPTVTSATEGTTTFDGRCSSYARSYPFEWTIPTGHINSQRLDSLLELELGPVHNAPPEACGLG